MLQKLEELKRKWPVFAFTFLMATLALAAGISSAGLFAESVQLRMLSAVLGYGMGVSLFARFFRLCMQRLAACMLFYCAGSFFLGMVFAVLFSFALLCAYGCAWGCIFRGLKGLKILLGGAVFLIQMLMQVLPLCMLLIAAARRLRQQVLERNIPKSSIEATRDSFPHMKECMRAFGCWAAFAFMESVFLDGIFELLEYTLF